MVPSQLTSNVIGPLQVLIPANGVGKKILFGTDIGAAKVSAFARKLPNALVLRGWAIHAPSWISWVTPVSLPKSGLD